MIGFVVTQMWFRSGTFIAGGDTTPFVRDNIIHEFASMWSHDTTGAGGPSYHVARAPELIAIEGARFLGVSEVVAQQAFYALVVVAVVLSGVYLAFAFTKRSLIAAACGMLITFNAYHLQRLPNLLPLWALATMACAAGLLIRVARGNAISPLFLVLLSVAGGYLALNPPLLLILLLWVVLVIALGKVMGGAGGIRRVTVFVFKALPWIALINLWWLVPWVITLFGGSGSAGIVAESDVEAWSWTHQRNSILNVATLSSAWGWDDPRYFPFAADLNAFPWSSLKFFFPLLAFSAPLLTKDKARRLSLWLIGVCLILIFIGKGLHSPLAGVNLFLYNHVPGMWLLREPVSKLGPMLILLYGALVAVTLSAAIERLNQSSGVRNGLTVGFACSAVVWGLVYPYPLYTPEFLPEDRPGLPSVHVQIPEAWRSIAASLNETPGWGKILMLPLNDYYQIPTTWGYYGADAIPKRLLERPTLQINPGGYFGEMPGLEAQIALAEKSLFKGEIGRVPPLLESLGVSHIVLRKDIDRKGFPDREFKNPYRLKAGLDAMPQLEISSRSPMAWVYELKEPAGAFVTGNKLHSISRSSSEDLAEVVSTLPERSVATDDPSVASRGRAFVSGAGPITTSFPAEAGKYIVRRRVSGRQLFHLGVSRSQGAWTLDVGPASPLRIDGEVLPRDEKLHLEARKQPRAIFVDDQFHTVGSKPTLAAAKPNARLKTYAEVPRFAGRKLVLGEGACDPHDRASSRGISRRTTPGRERNEIRLLARHRVECATLDVPQRVDQRPYLVTFEYRWMQGAAPRICVWQEGPNTCARVPSPPLAKKRETYRAAFSPDPGTKRLRVFFFADPPSSGGETRINYQEARVAPLEHLEIRDGRLPSLKPELITLGYETHTLELKSPLPASFGPLSEVADCNAYDRRTSEEVGLDSDPLPAQPQPAVRLTAPDHAACVTTRLTPFFDDMSYEIGFDYRTVSGQTARFCLLQEGAGDCADLAPLEHSSDWTTYKTTFTPSAGSTGVRLYLYAYGDSSKSTTITEFRNLGASLFAPVEARLDPAEPPSGPPPSVESTLIGPSTYKVEIGRSEDAFVLTFNETFASGWELKGLPDRRSAEHIRVNGYANGWLIDKGRPLSLVVEFSPDRYAETANAVSAVAAMGLLGAFALGRGRRQRVTARLKSRIRSLRPSR